MPIPGEQNPVFDDIYIYFQPGGRFYVREFCNIGEILKAFRGVLLVVPLSANEIKDDLFNLNIKPLKSDFS